MLSVVWRALNHHKLQPTLLGTVRSAISLASRRIHTDSFAEQAMDSAAAAASPSEEADWHSVLETCAPGEFCRA
jgi:hypothetical protein